MKNRKKRILEIFDYIGHSKLILWLLLFTGSLLSVRGIDSGGHYVAEKHEESIVYAQYQPGAELGDYVSFTAVSAEIGGYTEEENWDYRYVPEDGEEFGHFKQVYDSDEFYGYIILTDAAENRIISRKSRNRVFLI